MLDPAPLSGPGFALPQNLVPGSGPPTTASPLEHFPKGRSLLLRNLASGESRRPARKNRRSPEPLHGPSANQRPDARQLVIVKPADGYRNPGVRRGDLVGL